MSIKSVHLRNFQSHKATDLDLAPGVNVIVGQSDCGKSAIVRALRWLVFNKPGGTAFRSTWGGDTEAAVDLGDIEVRRVRTDKENLYHVGDRRLAAFGNDPPQDVLEALRLDEVNIQQQLDRPFLLDTPPGQVAAYLNQVARLDIIDTALQRIGKWVRALGADVQRHEANRTSLEESLASFEYLPAMEEAVAVLEADTETLEILRIERAQLSTHTRRLQSVEQSYAVLAPRLRIRDAVEVAIAALEAKRRAEAAAQSLRLALTKLATNRKSLDRLDRLLTLQPLIERVDKAQKAVDDVKSVHGRLAALIGRVARTEDAHRKAVAAHKRLHKEFDEAIGKHCPLCEAELRG